MKVIKYQLYIAVFFYLAGGNIANLSSLSQPPEPHRIYYKEYTNDWSLTVFPAETSRFAAMVANLKSQGGKGIDPETW